MSKFTRTAYPPVSRIKSLAPLDRKAHKSHTLFGINGISFTPMLQARSFTYASDEQKWWQQSFIRCVEVFTGRLKVWRLYAEYSKEYLSTDETFWDAAIRKLDLTVKYDREKLASIPKTGPLVVVANHPYGVLDGVIITHMMMRVRDDFKVLTNSVLCQAPEASAALLPIDFATTEEALHTNLQTRKAAREILKNNGCITVFPAGGVSTIPTWKDKAWQPFIARLIQESKADVVPIFFEGQNSRLFQCASLLSPTLRLSLFFKEVADKIGCEIGVVIGDLIKFEDIAHIKDRAALCHHLRKETYRIGGMGTLPEPKAAYRLDDGKRKER